MEGATMQAAHENLNIVVVYYSRFGVLKTLAELIVEGTREVEYVDVELLEVGDRPLDELLPGESEPDMQRRRAAVVNRLAGADALIVGAPSYFGSMASPVKRLLEDCVTASHPPVLDRSRPWRSFRFRDKVGAAFTASGTPHGGNEQTLLSILTLFMHLGMLVVTPGQRPPVLLDAGAPYGATAIAGPAGDQPPTVAEQEEARALGRRVAEVAAWVRWGRADWEQAVEEHRQPPALRGDRFDPSA
jgi:NAD(P)H dehydrogenase (quinone)